MPNHHCIKLKGTTIKYAFSDKEKLAIIKELGGADVEIIENPEEGSDATDTEEEAEVKK